MLGEGRTGNMTSPVEVAITFWWKVGDSPIQNGDVRKTIRITCNDYLNADGMLPMG